MSRLSHIYRNMLQKYNKQNTSFSFVDKGPSFPIISSEEVALSEEGNPNEVLQQASLFEKENAGLRHKLLTERVTQELFDNLLFTQSHNPLVIEIKEELQNKLNATYLFKYQLLSKEVQIFQETELGLIEVLGQEKRYILDVLWHIIFAKVQETMPQRPFSQENVMEIKRTTGGSTGSLGVSSTKRSYANSVQAVNSVASPSGVSGPQGDTISVSSEGILRTEAFRVAMTAADIRQERIAAIKEKIATGSYTIDTKKLAFNLIREEATMGL